MVYEVTLSYSKLLNKDCQQHTFLYVRCLDIYKFAMRNVNRIVCLSSSVHLLYFDVCFPCKQPVIGSFKHPSNKNLISIDHKLLRSVRGSFSISGAGSIGTFSLDATQQMSHGTLFSLVGEHLVRLCFWSCEMDLNNPPRLHYV